MAILRVQEKKEHFKNTDSSGFAAVCLTLRWHSLRFWKFKLLFSSSFAPPYTWLGIFCWKDKTKVLFLQVLVGWFDPTVCFFKDNTVKSHMWVVSTLTIFFPQGWIPSGPHGRAVGVNPGNANGMMESFLCQ